MLPDFMAFWAPAEVVMYYGVKRVKCLPYRAGKMREKAQVSHCIICP